MPTPETETDLRECLVTLQDIKTTLPKLERLGIVSTFEAVFIKGQVETMIKKVTQKLQA